MKTTFIVIFGILLSLPLLFLNTDPKKILYLENRGVTKKPEKFMPKDVENWINDNIGFKNEVLFIKKTFDYFLFERYNLKLSKMGLDGHLFYYNENTDVMFSGKETLNPQELKDFAKSFMNLKEYFNSFGAKFYVIAIPNKESIYPEFYPKNLAHKSNNIFDATFKILKNYNINTLHLKQALLNTKAFSKDPLYYKLIDPSHWNHNGAFAGYRAIMKMIRKDFQSLKILTKNDFNITISTIKRPYIVNPPYMNFLSPILYSGKDLIYDFRLKNMQNIDLILNKPSFLVHDKASPHHSFNYTNKDIKKNGKTLLIIGDSYINSFILPWLAQSFQKTYFVYNNLGDKKYINTLLTKIKPDIVMYQFVERMMPYKTQLYINEQIYDNGFYNDGWLGAVANATVTTKNKKTLTIRGYYPKKITPNLTGKVFIDDVAHDFKITKNNFTLQFNLPKKDSISLKIKSNFAFKADPPDNRILSFILNSID